MASGPSKDVAQTPIVIPRMVLDPVVSLAPYPVEVVVGFERVHIPAIPAVEWLAMLMVGDKLWLEDVIPGMVDRSEVIEDALADGDITPGDVQDLALGAIEMASGRPWWVALRLIETVRGNWDNIGAEFAYRNIDAGRISLSAWLDASLMILLKAMDRDKIQMFLNKLESPPPGEENVTDQGIAEDDFLSMM